MCNIGEPGCQHMAAEAAACLRGVAPVSVPIWFVSRAEHALRSSTPLPPEEERASNTWNAALSLLRLAPDDATSARAIRRPIDSPFLFYSSPEKRITIVQGGWALDSPEAVAMLVRENIHALQDSWFGLAEFHQQFSVDFDRTLAARAIIEGEATLVQDLATIGLFGESPEEIRWDQVFEKWKKDTLLLTGQTSAPFTFTRNVFPYVYGAAFVHAASDGGKRWETVDALHRAPPSSSREVMAGFGAADPTGGPWAEDLGPDSVPVPPPGLTYFDSDHLGAWIFDAFMARLQLEDPPAFQLRGDVFSILEIPFAESPVAAVWRLRFASFDEAAAVHAFITRALRDSGPLRASHVRQIERDLVLIAVDDPLQASGYFPPAEPLVFQAAPIDPGASPRP
jgi:hypothetical protein